MPSKKPCALYTWGVLQIDYAFCPLPIVNTYSQSISILFAVRTIGQFWQFGISGIREVRAKISIGDSVGLGVVRIPTVVSTAVESGAPLDFIVIATKNALASSPHLLLCS